MTTGELKAAGARRASPEPRTVSWSQHIQCWAAVAIALSPSLRADAQVPEDRYRTLLHAANVDVDASRYLAGKAELQAAISMAPGRAEAWTELGLLYGRAGDFSDAERALRQSLHIDANQAKAHYLLGLTLTANPLEKQDWASAIQEFREATRLDTNDTDAMDHLGLGLLATGKTDEAIDVLEHTIELTPGKAGPQFDLGAALESKGDLDGAAKHYRLALKAKPDNSEATSALGKVLFTQNHLDEAESWLRDALSMNPDLQAAHYTLGRVLRKEGKPDQAQHEFDETAALDGRVQKRIDSSQLSNGALAKAGKGDFAGAEEDLREAIYLRADYGVPHYNLGLILADEGQMTASEQQLELAISLMPGRARPWIDLAKVQSRLGHLGDARSSIGLALRLEPGSESAQQLSKSLGTLRPEEPPHPGWTSAIALSLLTEDTVAGHTELARQLQSEGDWADASGEWLRVLMDEPAAEASRLEMAKCFEHMDDSAGAILEERKVLLVNPKNVQAHIALGMSLFLAGSRTEAREQLQQALALDPGSRIAKETLRRLEQP